MAVKDIEALLEAVEDIEPTIDLDAVRVFVRDIMGTHYTPDYAEDVIAQFHDAFIGSQSVEDYAYEYARDCMGLEGFALDYFDVDKFARDLVWSGDVSDIDGYLFWGSW